MDSHFRALQPSNPLPPQTPLLVIYGLVKSIAIPLTDRTPIAFFPVRFSSQQHLWNNLV